MHIRLKEIIVCFYYILVYKLFPLVTRFSVCFTEIRRFSIYCFTYQNNNCISISQELLTFISYICFNYIINKSANSAQYYKVNTKCSET